MTTRQELERMHEGLSEVATRNYWAYALSGSASYTDAYRDPSTVPAGAYLQLKAFAQSIGYTVTKHAMDQDTLGKTGTMDDFTPIGINLNADLNEASRVRVLCHELGHALLRHHRVHPRELPEATEEVIAESVAALVTGALRCSNGGFSAGYVARNSGGDRHRLAYCRPIAVDLADEILKGINHK